MQLLEQCRIPAEADNARRDFQAAAVVIQGELGAGPYLLGEFFTVADIVLAHTLHWAGWTDLLKGFDGLEAYLARCVARPAARGCCGADHSPAGVATASTLPSGSAK